MDAFVREFMRFEFTLQLLLVFALMLFPSRRRRFFVLRLILCLIPVGVASYFLIPVGFVTANVRFIAIFLLCVAAAFICFFIDFKNALLCGLGAYAIQHACYCISEVFRLAVSSSMESFLWEWVVTRLLFLLSLAAMYFFFIRKFHEKGDFMIKNRPLLLLVVVIVAATIVISNVEGYLDYTVNMPFDGVKIVFCVYRFLCCCLALAIQSGLFERNRLEQENKVLERLRETERRRYETVKDNIDLVNIKYHDLKHMLPLLEEMGDRSPVKEKFLREVKSSISALDIYVKTGNEALDAVITDKSIYCKKNGIRFTYMVDGRKLGFMEQTDIYSLFGNILDNAIESVGGLAEEKRFLDLRISVKNAFLCISAENYCENEPRFAEGLPVTTKEDKAYHGFGVRSMSAVVKKYGGEIRFSYKDHLFSVTIFFPIR